MNVHVLLNLLNKLGKKKRCDGLPSILSVFPNEFDFIKTRFYLSYDSNITFYLRF